MENKIFVNNIPSMTKETIPYRSKLSSDTINQMQDDALRDILDLFNKSNQLTKEIREMELIGGMETHCYNMQLSKLKEEIALLLQENERLKSTPGSVRSVIAYATSAKTEEGEYGAHLDTNTCDITPGVLHSVSRIRVLDATSNETYVPSSLQAAIGPDSFSVEANPNIYSIEDSDLTNAFNGDYASAWVRKVVTNTLVDSIENELTLGLPEDILTSRMVNEIIYQPLLSGYSDLVDIKYRVNGGWQTIPGFEAHQGVEVEPVEDIFGNQSERHLLPDCPSCRFTFPGIETNQIKLVLRQRHYVQSSETGQRIFYLGISNLDILYHRYHREYSSFTLDFPIDEEGDVDVLGVDLYYNNNDVNGFTNVSCEYSYYDRKGNTHKVQGRIPFTTEYKTIQVRITITGDKQIPNIQKAHLLYKQHIV